ncbi:hypothetical protein EVAR_8476_1 [Eumeta japonica]|uniref:Uncharacterized protein n=1 Tax=Eumeta variegata TaxID=151549 RepID=A0A4C1XPC4_EUMVA|nr:hypothetical protein EVAR_8476_1 [Eumeta japonica]
MVGDIESRKISSPVRRALNLKKKPNIISRSDDDSFKVIKNEFSKAGTNWFRLGNQRAGSQPKQMLKKWHLQQTNADATERNSPPAGN